MEGNVGLGGRFIATVKGYNKTSRELEVFIPKLMPAIPENQRRISIMTNYGNNDLNDITYNNQITIAGTITVRARDADEKIPNIGSKVFVEFLEENPELGIWYKCNINNDYSVIEDEKYSKVNTLIVDEKEVDVYEDDRIQIVFPEELSAIVLKNGKNISIKIDLSDSYKDDINRIKEVIGNSSYDLEETGMSGEIRKIAVKSSGLIKRIENTERAIPTAPNDDGDYSLKVSIVNGKPTYKWVKE